jgi:hypothetical protein
MTDYVQRATLVASLFAAIGVGGSAVAFFTERSKRTENERIWRRDHVTERYTALQQSIVDVEEVLTTKVMVAYRSSPVPSLDPLWDELDAAYRGMMRRMLDTSIVARPAVAAMLPLIAAINYNVMTPVARSNGVPSIAVQRSQTELVYITALLQCLGIAMRLDLGLIPEDQLRTNQQQLEVFQQ